MKDSMHKEGVGGMVCCSAEEVTDVVRKGGVANMVEGSINVSRGWDSVDIEFG